MNSTSYNPSMLPPEALLEAFIPGYSFLAHLVSFYFRIDISSYLFVFVASFAFWMYAVLVIWDQLQLFLLRCASTIEVRCHDDLYNDAMRWISTQPDLSQARRVVAGTKINFATVFNDDENDSWEDLSEEDQLRFENDPREFWIKRKHLDKLRKVRYTPAPVHIHYFTYNRCWVALRRQPFKDANSPWVANLISEIQKFSSDQDNDSISIRRGLRLGSNFQWVRVASKKPRPLSTVVLDSEQKQRIIKDVQEYLHPRTCSWYRSRGFPYRRGYLFRGPPGTGKSSLCLGIASLVQLDIFMVSLRANDLDENGLALLFQSLPKRCIVLFEDVHQAGMPKRNIDNTVRRTGKPMDDGEKADPDGDEGGKVSNGITLSAFLNVIDGVSAQEGRILIMTTNDACQLDGALLRPGRVDMEIAFAHADPLAIQEHFLVFYMKPAGAHVMGFLESSGCARSLSMPACSKWTSDDIIRLSATFANNVPPHRYSAADVQNYLLQYRNDPMAAVHNVSKWVAKQQPHFNDNSGPGRSAFRANPGRENYIRT